MVSQVKPILRNRDQVSVETFDPDVDSINHFMEHPPKDDVELKAKDKPKKGAKPVVEEKIVASEVTVVEPVMVKEVAFTCGRPGPNNTNGSAASVPQPQQPGTPKKQKKKTVKTDSLDTIDGGEELLLQVGGTEKLLGALRQLPLTASELQTMIEVLLNRQQEATEIGDSDWMERGGRLDPIGSLRKQLAEKDKALQEELEEKQAYQNKVYDRCIDKKLYVNIMQPISFSSYVLWGRRWQPNGLGPLLPVTSWKRLLLARRPRCRC